MSTEAVTNPRLSPKILSIVFLIVVSFVIIDVTISTLVDIWKDFSKSFPGKSLFITITGVLFAGTYVMLKMTGEKISNQNKNKTYEKNIAKGAWAIYFLMVVMLAYVIFQIVSPAEQQYNTSLLWIVAAISYGFAAFVMGALAFHFFSWFTRNRSLVVLLYGLASVSASIFVVSIVAIFYMQISYHPDVHPEVTTPQSSMDFPNPSDGLENILINEIAQILTATTFLLFWGGTIVILYANLKRIGKKTFWILVTTPIIFVLGTLMTLYPEMQAVVPENDPNSTVIAASITSLSQIIAIALFAIAFVTMARATPHDQISNYLYITCYGLALFSIGIIATVSAAGYPPFGLPTVSLVGPFSFLLFTGIYRSAISTAQDSNLRRSIKDSTLQQLKLLKSIGTAEMERKLEKEVFEVMKSNADNLMEQSGIESSLSKYEARQYLYEAIEEAKKIKNDVI